MVNVKIGSLGNCVLQMSLYALIVLTYVQENDSRAWLEMMTVLHKAAHWHVRMHSKFERFLTRLWVRHLKAWLEMVPLWLRFYIFKATAGTTIENGTWGAFKARLSDVLSPSIDVWGLNEQGLITQRWDLTGPLLDQRKADVSQPDVRRLQQNQRPDWLFQWTNKVPSGRRFY